MISKLFKILLSITLLAGVPQEAWTAPALKRVRIAILQDVADVTIDLRGGYAIIDPATQRVLDEGQRIRREKIVFTGGSLRLGDKSLGHDRIRIVPRTEIYVRVRDKDRRYRGFIDVIGAKGNLLTVVNILDFEDYIKGVLYHEVSHRWSMEAIKSQAVASRSYVLHQVRANKAKDYDVTSDIYSQVYGGRTSEKYRTNLAVQRTAGQVLAYKGKILPSYFHATCSGMTEDVRELWKHDLPPLKSVRCNFCKNSPHMRWKKNMRLKDIQDKLNKKGQAIGPILDIKILERNVSDRIRMLELTGRAGDRLRISGKDFRNIIGPNEIRSNRYDIVMRGYYMDFLGKGWGHGVGLCQWGAQGMGLQDYDYKQILRHYYPGAELVDYRTLK